MKKSILVSLSFLLILGFGISVFPTQPADAAGQPYDVYPGDSIQAAIDATLAAGGGTIYFAPGVYYDSYIFIGPSDNVDKLELVGTGATLNDLYDWLLGEPVSGTVLEAAIHIDGANYPVTVQGFGLFNWYADYHPGQPWFDRAITVEYSEPTISDCVISHRITVGDGGGMRNVSSSPIVTNTVFIFCQAGEEGSVAHGGAIANWYSSPTITNSMFLYNFAQGGGKVVAACGGAIFNYGSSPTLINCVFYDNQVRNANEPVYGDAIYNTASNTMLMNIISWNHPGETIFYWGGFTVNYSDTEDDFPGDGNISSDPMFVYAPLIEDMTFDDIPLLDFHLEPDSPCIDTGDNLAVPDWVSTDIEGNPRILNGTVDMGAYEFVLEGGPAKASFIIEHAKIDFKKKNRKDKIHVKGRFELGYGNEVDISADMIIVTIGLFTEEISMSTKGKGDKWEYKRPKGKKDGIKDMKIDWKKGKKGKGSKEAKVDIKVDKADLGKISDWSNPVTISIQIGDDMGFETITMKEHKHHWDYHKKKH